MTAHLHVCVLLGLLMLNTMEVQSQASSTASQKQRVYQSPDATFLMTAHYKDTAIFARSKQLVVIMDYETSEVMMRLDLGTIHTDNIYLMALLDSLESDQFVFEGKAQLPYINPDEQGHVHFKIEGHLQFNNIRDRLVIDAELMEARQSTRFSNQFMGNFEIDFNAFGLKGRLPGMEPRLTIQVTQAAMERRM